MEYRIGKTGTYINDHRFQYVSKIPIAAAVAWVKAVCPETGTDCLGKLKAKELTINENIDTDANENGWLNKKFIIVGFENGKWVALNRHDDKFSVRMKDWK